MACLSVHGEFFHQFSRIEGFLVLWKPLHKSHGLFDFEWNCHPLPSKTCSGVWARVYDSSFVWRLKVESWTLANPKIFRGNESTETEITLHRGQTFWTTGPPFPAQDPQQSLAISLIQAAVQQWIDSRVGIGDEVHGEHDVIVPLWQLFFFKYKMGFGPLKKVWWKDG